MLRTTTHRELLAVKYVLDSFGEMLRNQSVQVNIDNSSAFRILSVGSTKPYLQNIAIDVFSFCSKFNIKLIPQWIPREQNQLADAYSRNLPIIGRLTMIVLDLLTTCTGHLLLTDLRTT